MNSSSRLWRITVAVISLALSLTLLPATAHAQLLEKLLGPKVDVIYVPTGRDVVNGMLNLADVSEKDTVYDLGCGDGRIVISAAKDRGARGVGIDLNPWLIKEANANARKAGVEDRVTFIKGDLFHADFSEATVVTLYLLPEINQRLRPQLWKQLKVGTRVLSHDFHMGDEWPAERIEKIGNKTIYFWTIRDEHKKAST